MTEVVVKVSSEIMTKSRLKPSELSEIAEGAIKEALWKDLLLQTLDEALENSEMTEELALKLGDEFKTRIAHRHGLV